MSPSIVLIPGVCSVGSIVYAPLKQTLHDIGFEKVKMIDLKSVDALDRLDALTPNPLEADISGIRAFIEKEIEDQGKEFLLVAHSYSGTPTLYACNGLWKHEREKKGLKGGVVRICLLSSSLMPPGETVAGARVAYGDEHGTKLDEEGTARVEMVGQHLILYPDNLCMGFMSDMSPEEQKKWGGTLKPSPLSGLMSSALEGKPSDWRIAFLVTTELDPAMPQAL